MSLAQLVGARFGPVPLSISAEKVAEYVAATGDDADRWADHAPPSYAGALLFAIAPLFWTAPDVAPLTRVLIHADQRFEYLGPIDMGVSVRLTGTIDSVRERNGLYFVKFGAEVATAGGDPLVRSVSTFLLGDERTGDPAPEHDEPPVRAHAVTEADGEQSGSSWSDQRSASRLDLVRYAGAAADFNPIHFDHGAAVDAGLGGVVVHGLLMGAWLAQLAGSRSKRPDPLANLQLRFVSPLYAAQPALLTADVGAAADGRSPVRLALTSDGTDLVTGRASVWAE